MPWSASKQMNVSASLREPAGRVQHLGLVIDDTTAHILAPSELAERLLSWFCEEGIACSLRRGAGMGGRDVIDFGNPPPAVEKRICSLFIAWQKSGG